jgi:glycerol-3-phosphate acyltransferase PlsY
MKSGRREAAMIGGASWIAGSVPFAQMAARLLAGTDLRRHGSGTVSGTGLYEVAGPRALVVFGILDVLKGAAGPWLARRSGRADLVALAGAATVIGHNWSPFLHGAGGRGVAPALGVTVVAAPEGTAVLAAGLALGRLGRQTGLGTAVALVAMTAVLARRRGRNGLALGLGLLMPMMAKRALGNRPLPPSTPWRALATRLLFDRDPATETAAVGEAHCGELHPLQGPVSGRAEP